MKISSLFAAIVVIATIGTIAFVGFSENNQAFSSEETTQNIEISIKDTVSFSDSVIISVSNSTNAQT